MHDIARRVCTDIWGDIRHLKHSLAQTSADPLLFRFKDFYISSCISLVLIAVLGT